MKSIIFLALVCVCFAQEPTNGYIPQNYTTLTSGVPVNGFLLETTAEAYGDYYYFAYVPQLFLIPIPENAAAVVVTISQPSNDQCTEGLTLYGSNYAFPCYPQDDSYSPLYNDFCNLEYGSDDLIDDYVNPGDSYTAIINAYDPEYYGSNYDRQFTYTPGANLFLSVQREDEDDGPKNCTFTLNATIVLGCSAGQVAFATDNEQENNADTIQSDVQCVTYTTVGSPTSTGSFTFNRTTFSNNTDVYKVVLPQNVAYVNVTGYVRGSNYVYMFGGPAPAYNDYDDNTAQYEFVCNNGDDTDNCYNNKSLTLSGSFIDVNPRAGNYYVSIYSQDPSDNYNGFVYSLTITVYVCSSSSAGDQCEYPLTVVNPTSLFTTGIPISVPAGKAAYYSFEVNPAYTLTPFQIFANYPDYSAGNARDLYFSIKKDQVPLSIGNGDDYDVEIESQTEIISFTPLDFLANNNTYYYMEFYCSSGSGTFANCNFTIFANLTFGGSAPSSTTGFASTTGYVSTTGHVSTTGFASTTGHVSTTGAITSAFMTQRMTTGAVRNTTTVGTTGAKANGAAAAGPSFIIALLIALLALMF